jgi:ATP-dependent Clp protease ATP-binding subunit ClpA
MDRFDKFTDRAHRALTDAQREAARFHQNYIGAEHLLLGLIGVEGGVGAKALVNLGVELAKVRTAVEFLIGHGDRPTVGEVGLTPAAKRVIELAIDEARSLGHRYIGTEHILLGLMREGDNIGAAVLESLGVTLALARQRCNGSPQLVLRQTRRGHLTRGRRSEPGATSSRSAGHPTAPKTLASSSRPRRPTDSLGDRPRTSVPPQS